MESQVFDPEKRLKKWNKFSSSGKTLSSKACSRKVITKFLVGQHKKIPVNRQIGEFRSYFFLWERTAAILSLLKILIHLLFYEIFEIMWIFNPRVRVKKINMFTSKKKYPLNFHPHGKKDFKKEIKSQFNCFKTLSEDFEGDWMFNSHHISTAQTPKTEIILDSKTKNYLKAKTW